MDYSTAQGVFAVVSFDCPLQGFLEIFSCVGFSSLQCLRKTRLLFEKKTPFLVVFCKVPPGVLQVSGKSVFYSSTHVFVLQNEAAFSFTFCS